MEHQAPEDGEQTFQGSYYVMMNRLVSAFHSLPNDFSDQDFG